VGTIFEEYEECFALSERLRFIPGDVHHGPLPTGHVICFGHVLHGYEETKRRETTVTRDTRELAALQGRSDAAASKPRHESEPWEQIRDYQHAITHAQNQQDIDPDRIGAWGSSYSAGHAFVVAAIDRRVKAVVGQVPVVSGLREFQGMVRVDMEDHNHEAFAADRRARARGEGPTVIPVVAKDPLVMSALPMAEAYEYFYGPDGVIERDPSFPNEITLPGGHFDAYRGHAAYARRILGWRVASTMATSMVLDAIEQAIWTRQQDGIFDLNSVVHHTDRGSQGEFNWSSQHLECGGGVRWAGLRAG
jgi:Acetyl xylan esterase (AXE1)